MRQLHLNLKTVRFPSFLPFSPNNSEQEPLRGVSKHGNEGCSTRFGPEAEEEAVLAGRVTVMVARHGLLSSSRTTLSTKICDRQGSPGKEAAGCVCAGV